MKKIISNTTPRKATKELQENTLKYSPPKIMRVHHDTIRKLTERLTADPQTQEFITYQLTYNTISTNQFKLLNRLTSLTDWNKKTLIETRQNATNLYNEINKELSRSPEPFSSIIQFTIGTQDKKLNCFTLTSTSLISPIREPFPRNVHLYESEVKEIQKINQTSQLTGITQLELLISTEYPLIQMALQTHPSYRTEGMDFYISTLLNQRIQHSRISTK